MDVTIEVRQEDSLLLRSRLTLGVTPYLGRHALTRNYARPGLPPGRARNRPKTSVSIAEVYHLAGPLAEVRQENRSGNKILYY